MITILYNAAFLKARRTFPEKLYKKLGVLIEILRHNPFDSRLHTKKLSGELAGLLSSRITRDWRVVFQFLDSNKIQFLRVVHRKDAYR